jgi:hypothetical protein
MKAMLPKLDSPRTGMKGETKERKVTLPKNKRRQKKAARCVERFPGRAELPKTPGAKSLEPSAPGSFVSGLQHFEKGAVYRLPTGATRHRVRQ